MEPGATKRIPGVTTNENEPVLKTFEVKMTDIRRYYKTVKARNKQDAIAKALDDNQNWLLNDSDQGYIAYRRPSVD
jgi:hypothetical protein